MNILARKLPTILGLLLLGVMAGGGWWWLASKRPKVTEGIKPQKVRITNVADNKFSVSWISQDPSFGQIEYGPVGDRLERKQGDDRGETTVSKTHHITVNGLQPRTQYAFRILSGENKVRFDNNGSPYGVTTGSRIGETPAAKRLYGEVKTASGQAAEGSIVYLALPEAVTASGIVTSSGNYSLPLLTIRTNSGDSYVNYDEKTAVASIEVEDGNQSAKATLPLALKMPVPTIVLGETYDFRTQAPAIAEKSGNGETPTVLNVEPLGDVPAKDEVVLLNPAEEGEELATTLPEFRGLGPETKTLTITVHSSAPYTGTVVVAADGTWAWSPPAELEPGEHTITISYVDVNGLEKNLSRSFTVTKALAAEGNPSFEATPSGGTYPSPSPSASLAASATPRTQIPGTESGVPVSGVWEYTALTGVVGIVMMIIGAAVLAL